MIYTCAEAAKVLRKLNEDLKVLRAKEVKGYRFTAAVDEDLESARPVYDYLQTQEEQRQLFQYQHSDPGIWDDSG